MFVTLLTETRFDRKRIYRGLPVYNSDRPHSIKNLVICNCSEYQCRMPHSTSMSTSGRAFLRNATFIHTIRSYEGVVSNLQGLHLNMLPALKEGVSSIQQQWPYRLIQLCISKTNSGVRIVNECCSSVRTKISLALCHFLLSSMALT
jgi:hypothetical protein